MLRALPFVLRRFLFVFVAVTCFAQNPQAPGPDADSADIPPLARGRIDAGEYLKLRDQHISMQRGLADLAANPQARTQAVQQMQLREELIRKFQTGTAPLPGLSVNIVVGPTWTPLGPDPIPNGQTDPGLILANEKPVSGRVTAIAVDPNDATGNTAYVGAAQGGVYRTLDGGATWTPLLDSAASLAIGSITIDPVTPTTVFVGTGESNLSQDSFFGVGLYIITNATAPNPTVSGPFHLDGVGNDVFTGRSISQILVNPGNENQILVSTSSGFSGLSADTFNVLPTRGVYLSTNALSATPTFTRLTIQTAAANRIVTDMAIDPGNANLVLVHVFGNAVATDGGVWVVSSGSPWNNTATWTQTLIDSADNGKFAVNRSGATPATTFMLALDQTVTCGTSSVGGTLRKSSDGGQTWTEITAARGFCGGQCFYDAVVAMHPDDPNTIYIAGSADGGPAVGACGSGIMGKSTNGGTSFGANDTFLHADSHAMAFAPANHSVLYTGNDGGIFRSADAGATWSSINTSGFNATQFMSFSVHPTDPNFAIGGTQDNGTELMNSAGTWTRADFGDGGYSAIDQNATDTTNVTMYHTYFNQTGNLIGFAQVTTSASATENNWNFFGCPAAPGNGITANGITCTDAVLFYAPLALGPGNPNTLYFGTDRLYRSTNQGANMSVVSQGPFASTVNGNIPVSAIGISAQDDNVRLVGLTNGRIFATTAGANPMTDVTGAGMPAKYVARAVVDPNNKSTAYVTFDGYGLTGHVWKTSNLTGEPPTPTWSNSSSGLPDVPVNAFAVDPFNPSYLYAGTDIGVFNSIDGGANWSPYGSGLPRVAVFDVKIQPTSHKVRIGTHGRGAWEIAASKFTDSTSIGASSTSVTTGASVTFTATVHKSTGVPTPTGTVTFNDGLNVLGTGTVDNTGNATFSTSSLTVGSHNVTANYGGDSLYLSSGSLAVVVNVGSFTTTALTLGASSTTPNLGTTVTFTATLNTNGNLTPPTGTATFKDGANTIGQSSFVSATTTTFQTSALTIGQHSITTQYSGDGTYAGSTSAAVAVTVSNVPPDYSISSPTGTATVTAGQPATYTINVTPQGGFNSTLTFSCSGLPANSNCSFNPPSITPNGSTTSSTLTIATTARPGGAAAPAPNLSAKLWGGLGLFGLVLVGGAAVGTRGGRKRAWLSISMLLLVIAMVLPLTSCGGGGGTPPPPTVNPGTPAGTFTVVVTATGATTHSSNITLVVK